MHEWFPGGVVKMNLQGCYPWKIFARSVADLRRIHFPGITNIFIDQGSFTLTEGRLYAVRYDMFSFSAG
jgi:hypothetical protein